MAATEGTPVLVELNNRLTALEAGMSGPSNATARVAQIEIWIAGSSSAITNMASKIQEIEAQTGGIIDAKIADSAATLTANGAMQGLPQNQNRSPRSNLESRGARYRPSRGREGQQAVESEDEERHRADDDEV